LYRELDRGQIAFTDICVPVDSVTYELRGIPVKRLLLAIVLSLIAILGGAARARSQDLLPGDPPTDYWTYGDVAFDPACMHWNWQQRSWYDDCTRLHQPLAWHRGTAYPHAIILRAKD
jgi:hypothetical protein